VVAHDKFKKETGQIPTEYTIDTADWPVHNKKRMSAAPPVGGKESINRGIVLSNFSKTSTMKLSSIMMYVINSKWIRSPTSKYQDNLGSSAARTVL
jgi:hypothetical protein